MAAGNPFDPLTHFRNLAEVRNKTMRIEQNPETGAPIFRVMDATQRPYDDANEALRHINRSGLTIVNSFTNKTPDAYGAAAPVRRLAEQIRMAYPGAEVHEYIYNIDRNATDKKDLINKTFRSGQGIVHESDTGIHLIQATHNGKLLSSQQLFQAEEALGMSFGFKAGELDPKTGKRMATFMSKKEFEAYTSPLNVQVIDARSMMDQTELNRIRQRYIDQGLRGSALDRAMRQVDEIASDGFSLIARRGLRKVIVGYEDEIGRLQAKIDAPNVSRQFIEDTYREIQRTGESLEALRGIEADPGSAAKRLANIRATGLNIVTDNLPADLKKHAENLSSVILKGNTMFVDDTILPKGIDIMTDVRNLTKQAGLNLGRMGQPQSLVTLALHGTMRARMDIQHMSSYAGMLNANVLDQAMTGWVGKHQSMVKELFEGKIPGPMEEILDSQMKSGDIHAVREAREIRRLANTPGMSIADDPHLMNKMLDKVKQSMTRTKGDVVYPKLELPSMRGEVIPRWAVKHLNDPRIRNLKPGTSLFIENLGIIMHEADIFDYYAGFGGFDLDDALLNTIAKNKSGLVTFVSRQPQAMGEGALLRGFDYASHVGAIDDAVARSNYKRELKRLDRAERRIEGIRLRQSGYQDPRSSQGRRPMPDAEEVIRRKTIEARNARERMDRILRGIAVDVPDDIPLRGYDSSGRRLPGVADPGQKIWVNAEGRAIPVDQAQEIFEQGEGARYRYRGDPGTYITYHPPIAGSTADSVFDIPFSKMTTKQKDAFLSRAVLQGSAEVETSLGTYMNSRMFMDHWMSRNAKILRGAGIDDAVSRALSQLMEQEEVIDALTQLKTASGSDMARALNNIQEHMIRSTVELATLGVSRGLDTRLDPAYAEFKTYNPALLEETFDAIRPTLKNPVQYADIWMSPDDPGATFSRWLKGLDILDTIDEEARAQISELRVPERIMTSQSATRDAERLLGEYDDTMRSLRQRMPWAEHSQLRRAAESQMALRLTDLFDETGVVGDRAMSAVLRMAKMAEEQGRSSIPINVLRDVGRWEIGAEEGRGIWNEALRYGKTGRLGAEITSDDVFKSLASLSNRAMRPVLDEMLAGSNVSPRAIDTLNRGLSSRFMQSGLPESILDEMAQLPIPILSGLNPRSIGPTSSETFIRLGKYGAREEDELMTMGQLFYRYRSSMNPAERGHIAKQVSATMEGMYDIAQRYVVDEEVPFSQREWMARAIQQQEPPGSQAAARAAKAVEDAASVAAGVQNKKGLGNMMRDLYRSSAGKPLAAGAGLLLGAALVHSFRKRDRNIDDLQGPAHLPGGNPYAGINMQQPSRMGTFGSGGPPSSQQGYSFQVNTRGGNYDKSFNNQINNITGSESRSTSYDIPEPMFNSENARMRILGQYS